MGNENNAVIENSAVILSGAKDPDASNPTTTAENLSTPSSATTPRTPHNTVSSALASFSAASDASPQAILEREQREARLHHSLSDENIFTNSPRGQYEDRTPPQSGIAPDLAASSGLSSRSAVEGSASGYQPEDRGLYHASDAMKSMYDMGDSPSCATCGAIMTRSGSCYRCMSCGSTSGCS
jgi:ribonucleoside-diphosphate reductase alpha chain